MATLTNTKIKDTYDGLLKTTDNEALDVSGVTLIEDGLGNASALSVGRSGNGVSVSGLLDVSGEVQGTSLDINGAADISGNFAVDTNTLYVDAANNWVAVGATSIDSARLGVVTSSGVSTLKVHAQHNSSPVASLELQRGSGDAWGVDAFGDYKIKNDTANLIFEYGESGTTTERMRIDSSGNVDIGSATSNSDKLLQVYSPTTGYNAELWLGRNSVRKAKIVGEQQSANSDHDLVFYTNSAGADATEKMRIDSSGNVGIGESVPLVPLHISKNTASGENIALILDNNNTTANSEVGLLFRSAVGSTNTDFQIATINTAANQANLVFRSDGGTERMRIDSSGNVGIGVTPDVPLHLGGTSSSKIKVDRGSSTRLQIFQSNDGQSHIGSSGSNAALILRTGTTFGTDTERMRITSGGYLKASNTASYLSPTGTYHEFIGDGTAQVVSVVNSSATPDGMFMTFSTATPNNTSNYFAFYRDATAFRCIIYSNGNIVNANNSYGAISDAKLKENVVDASPKLDDLLQVKVRNFNYIGDDKKQLGVVAQELEEVFPSMIDESPDFEEQEVVDEEGNVTTEKVDLGTTTKSVKYSVFVPMLIKAMQEQQEIINDLKARIETLEAK